MPYASAMSALCFMPARATRAFVRPLCAVYHYAILRWRVAARCVAAAMSRYFIRHDIDADATCGWFYFVTRCLPPMLLLTLFYACHYAAVDARYDGARRRFHYALPRARKHHHFDMRLGCCCALDAAATCYDDVTPPPLSPFFAAAIAIAHVTIAASLLDAAITITT